MEAWKEELYHHGIKGQKWGVRRYQNLDGTLTSLGKKHVGQKSAIKTSNNSAKAVSGAGGGGGGSSLLDEDELKQLNEEIAAILERNPNYQFSDGTELLAELGEMGFDVDKWSREKINAAGAVMRNAVSASKEEKQQNREAVDQARYNIAKNDNESAKGIRAEKSKADDVDTIDRNVRINGRKTAAVKDGKRRSQAILKSNSEKQRLKDYAESTGNTRDKYADLVGRVLSSRDSRADSEKFRAVNRMGSVNYYAHKRLASTPVTPSTGKHIYKNADVGDDYRAEKAGEEMKRRRKDKRDKRGSLYEKAVRHSDSSDWIITSSGELYHHGVKGQKWGVRRYQNEDGTLTPAGKRHTMRELRRTDRKRAYAVGKVQLANYENRFNESESSKEALRNAQKDVDAYTKKAKELVDSLVSSGYKVKAKEIARGTTSKNEFSARVKIGFDKTNTLLRTSNMNTLGKGGLSAGPSQGITKFVRGTKYSARKEKKKKKN